jgi:tRNA A-37 threonylcarbamoyl transferase component Bud32
MEFIDGITLREKIHREQTDLRKLLRYLQHVAEGLAKAHAAGIVHSGAAYFVNTIKRHKAAGSQTRDAVLISEVR